MEVATGMQLSASFSTLERTPFRFFVLMNISYVCSVIKHSRCQIDVRESTQDFKSFRVSQVSGTEFIFCLYISLPKRLILINFTQRLDCKIILKRRGFTFKEYTNLKKISQVESKKFLKVTCFNSLLLKYLNYPCRCHILSCLR